VAKLRDRLVLRHEVPHDPLDIRIVADVLGRPPAGDDQGHIVRRVDVREGDIGRPGVPGLLGVGVVAVDEVVDHELELLGRWRGDVDLVALFEQALVGVHDLQRLRGVAGEYQDLWHDGSSCHRADGPSR